METPHALYTGDDPGWSVPDTPNLSSRSSPTHLSMFRRSLFEYPAVVREYVDREYVAHKYTRSMIPKGRSILAKGSGGMSNDAVIYTNSRSFKNVYKGSGSLEPSKLLQGMPLGIGMSKGQSILNSGGGLSGMSLFKMKHYNPLETSDDASGFMEGKHGEETSAFDKDGILVTALDGNRIYDSNGKFFTDSRGRKIYDASGNKNIYDDGEKTHTSTVLKELFAMTPAETIKQLKSSNIVEEKVDWKLSEHLSDREAVSHEIQATTTTVPAKQVSDAPMTSQELQLDQTRQKIAQTHKIIDKALVNKKLHENKNASDFKKFDEDLLKINKTIQTTTNTTVLFNVRQMLSDLKPLETGNPDMDAHFKQITDQMLKDITTKLDNQVSNAPVTDESKQVLNAPLTDRQLKSKEMVELIEQSNKLLNEDTNMSKLENERVQKSTDSIDRFNQMVKEREQHEAEEKQPKIKKKPKKTSSLKKDKQPNETTPKKTSSLKKDKKPNETTPKKEKQPKKETTPVDFSDKLKRIAMDHSGTLLKDDKGADHWGKHLTTNNKNRTYIIEEKIKNKWRLVLDNSDKYFHNFTNVAKITKFNENITFNSIGDMVMTDNYRITLWTKELFFPVKRYK